MNDLSNIFGRDYAGFAQANNESMEILQKALTAGTGVDAAAFTGGRALTPESLDYTLVNILFNQDEARLFQRLKKQPIKSVIHQWNQRTDVGSDDGAWVPEGGDSQEDNQTIAREFMAAKYLQTLRKVTLQASMSNMVEEAVALEKNAGTLWIIRNTEKGLIYGDSTMVSVQPDGLNKQIPTANIIDLRGAKSNTSAFEDGIVEGCRQIRDNYGKASLLLASTKVVQGIQELLRDRIRWPNPPANGGVTGSAFPTNYPTPFGSPEILDDIFIQEGGIPVVSTITSGPAAACTIGTGAANSAVSGSKFAAVDAGDYVYKVVACNAYGDAAASSELIITGVPAGGSASFVITRGDTNVTCYKIYRSIKGGITGATVKYMTTVVYVVGATQTFTDKNENLPTCSDVFLLTMDSVYDAIEWFQFLPMMKFDLYPTNAAVYPFLMLLFGGLALKKPVQHVRIKNVSPVSGGFYS